MTAVKSSLGKHRNKYESYGLYYVSSLSVIDRCSRDGNHVYGKQLVFDVLMLNTNDELERTQVIAECNQHYSRVLKAYWNIDSLDEVESKFSPRFVRGHRINGRNRLVLILPDRATKLANTVLLRHNMTSV
ncbi:MAG: hypothetical protein QXY15_10900 [Candidatus Nitrosotenuis sp.]